MVELQILAKLLQTKSLAVIQQNNITEDYFIGYKDEFKFIVDHHEKYGNVPDKETFLKEFRDLDLPEVTESDRYLIETLHEEYLYTKMVPFVHKIAEKVKEDATEAIKFAKSEIENMAKLSTAFKAGYDLIKNSMDRHREYEERMKHEGMLGIPTGIEELDKITHGWLPGEDLIVILGRTNEGKSWILLFFLVIAWMNGRKVMMYSGEMGHMVVGYRFDTFNKHFSNEGLMQGNTSLGEDKTATDYRKYLEELKNADNPFIIITPKDLGGNRITVPVLNQLIEQYQPDIVGVDQISLVDDARSKKGDQDRLKYTHVAEDLFLSSEKYGIPILAPAQANREAEKDKKDEDGTSKTPELHQIGESDGVAQNATRVVSIRFGDSMLKITVRKNRYGKKNQDIMMVWDIDKGVIRPFLAASTNDKGEATETKKLDQEGIGAGRKSGRRAAEGVDLF